MVFKQLKMNNDVIQRTFKILMIDKKPYLDNLTQKYARSTIDIQSDEDLLNIKQYMRSEGGGFQLVQILGLLGMYFDAVVVEVEKYLLFFRLVLADCDQSFLVLYRKLDLFDQTKGKFPKNFLGLSFFLHEGPDTKN